MITTLATTAFTPALSSGSLAIATPQTPVHFFLDLSNIFVNAREIAPAYGDGVIESQRLRLHAKHIQRLVQGNRQWADGYAAAGVNGNADSLRHNFQDAGIHLETRERGVLSGREQGIDEMIQREMLYLQFSNVRRGVVVLASGDGRPDRRGRGFLQVLRQLHDGGFDIELLSWKHSLNSAMRDWVSDHGRVVELDDYFDQLTFIKGGRRAKRVTSYASSCPSQS